VTVLELIKYLETLDETLPVVIWNDGYESIDDFDFYVNKTLNRLEIS
jgi:hypothetical protein